jgi:hypothetical protein
VYYVVEAFVPELSDASGYSELVYLDADSVVACYELEHVYFLV